ncbi:MAG: adenosylcobinamide-phosphate synthase CbiB [Cellvibrionaceae bacterium]|nr:adenosylcobinamide-phosphate synthase CbiB [Cellvibrionaceae bacterium]
MSSALATLVLALLLDLLLGEPKRYHPLVGFGNFASIVQRYLNYCPANKLSLLLGAVAWAACTLPWPALVSLVNIDNSAIQSLFDSIILYFCIAYRSLAEHKQEVLRSLNTADLPLARKSVAKIVSRETATLDFTALRKAAIESILENGLDAVFAPLFWFLLCGVEGAVFYRCVNTLDAMWGYKNATFYNFGKCAARIDDVMNFVPARLLALSYCLCGQFFAGWRAWQSQAKLCASPNAGPVMAAGAGALHIKLGGSAIYHGKAINKPELGFGKQTQNHDLERALRLLRHSLLLWLALISLCIGMYYGLR